MRTLNSVSPAVLDSAKVLEISIDELDRHLKTEDVLLSGLIQGAKDAAGTNGQGYLVLVVTKEAHTEASAVPQETPAGSTPAPDAPAA